MTMGEASVCALGRTRHPALVRTSYLQVEEYVCCDNEHSNSFSSLSQLVKLCKEKCYTIIIAFCAQPHGVHASLAAAGFSIQQSCILAGKL